MARIRKITLSMLRRDNQHYSYTIGQDLIRIEGVGAGLIVVLITRDSTDKSRTGFSNYCVYVAKKVPGKNPADYAAIEHILWYETEGMPCLIEYDLVHQFSIHNDKRPIKAGELEDQERPVISRPFPENVS